MITTLRASAFALLALCATGCMGEIPSQLVLGIGESCRASIDCADGLECETEHGQSTCQPHRSAAAAAVTDSGVSSGSDSGTPSSRSDSGGSSGSDSGSSDSGLRHDGADDDASAPAPDAASPTPTGGALGAGCAVNTDCAAPLECDLEHGVGTCQPHGGHGGR